MADIVTLDEVTASLNLGGDSSHDDELELYIAAVTAHVENRYGVLPAEDRVEIGVPISLGNGEVALITQQVPTEVASITDGTTTYDDDFTITPEGYVHHANLTGGRWTITYTGLASATNDLKLAALEDIRGLYQPGQIGPPAEFGAFGIDSTDVGVTYRPVRMWPRVDAWIDNRRIPGIA